MLWKGRRQSDNIEDRRGMTGRGVAVGGGLGALAIAVIVLLLGGNPEEVMQNLQTAQPQGQEQARALTAEEKELGEFVGVILADTEDVWNQVLRQEGDGIPRTQAGPVQPAPPIRPAASPSRPPGPSTARGTKRSTSTWTSSRRCSRNWGRAAISPGPTSSPTRSATTCRTCSASCSRPRSSMQGREPGRRPTACWCGWSCRPTSWPASGPTTPSA